MNLKEKLSSQLIYGRLLLTFRGLFYDYVRYIKFGGWKNKKLSNDNDSYVLKAFHSIEKSLSSTEKDSERGWGNLCNLSKYLMDVSKVRKFTYIENEAIRVINKFYFSNIESSKSLLFKEKYHTLIVDEIQSEDVGSRELFKEYFLDNGVNDPRKLFYSRYTIRDFSKEVVDIKTINSAISLAMKTPSACNRQAWSINVVQDESVLNQVLDIQNGNSSFREQISTVLVISSDISSFVSGNERYQHWIDGGMFSMGLVMAFHSIGVGSCCLNWSQMPDKDKLLKKILRLDERYSPVMLLAVGNYKDKTTVCVSPRKEINEIVTYH